MPVVGSGPNAPFYYSFDYGPVHFLSYSSEHDFGPGSEQWNFIQSDLAKASSPAARRCGEIHHPANFAPFPAPFLWCLFFDQVRALRSS